MLDALMPNSAPRRNPSAAQNPTKAAAWFRKAAESGRPGCTPLPRHDVPAQRSVVASETEANRLFAQSRQQHHAHHDHEQRQKWQRQLAEMNKKTGS